MRSPRRAGTAGDGGNGGSLNPRQARRLWRSRIWSWARPRAGRASRRRRRTHPRRHGRRAWRLRRLRPGSFWRTSCSPVAVTTGQCSPYLQIFMVRHRPSLNAPGGGSLHDAGQAPPDLSTRPFTHAGLRFPEGEGGYGGQGGRRGRRRRAMKMRTFCAPSPWKVKAIHAEPGTSLQLPEDLELNSACNCRRTLPSRGLFLGGFAFVRRAC